MARNDESFVPTAAEQAAMAAGLAALSYSVAKKEAAAGNSPERSAQKGTDFALYLTLYLFTVAPVGAIVTLFVWPPNVFMLWKFALSATFGMVSWRLLQWFQAPADYRLKYSVPTWAFVVLGGFLVAIGLLAFAVWFVLYPSPVLY
jgi:hypothetical protein